MKNDFQVFILFLPIFARLDEVKLNKSRGTTQLNKAEVQGETKVRGPSNEAIGNTRLDHYFCSTL